MNTVASEYHTSVDSCDGATVGQLGQRKSLQPRPYNVWYASFSDPWGAVVLHVPPDLLHV